MSYDPEVEGWKAEVARLRQENDKLRAALRVIADMCPATCDITLAHQMADEAITALARGVLRS